MRSPFARALGTQLVAGLLLVACAVGAPSEASVFSTEPTSASCNPAPDWLVDAISNGIVVRGAYLSDAYVGPASGFSDGPASLFSDEFAAAWWVAGRLNGAGLQPELATWVTNRTSASAEGAIFAVNAPARRYTSWSSGGSDPIAGAGLVAVEDCVGPMPRT